MIHHNKIIKIIIFIFKNWINNNFHHNFSNIRKQFHIKDFIKILNKTEIILKLLYLNINNRMSLINKLFALASLINNNINRTIFEKKII